MVNNTTRMVQIIATVLGLIQSTCIMEEVKGTFATAGTTGMSKWVSQGEYCGQVPNCDQLK